MDAVNGHLHVILFVKGMTHGAKSSYQKSVQLTRQKYRARCWTDTRQKTSQSDLNDTSGDWMKKRTLEQQEFNL
jgi:hypothetical protein